MNEDETCAKCGRADECVWCPAWGVYLCHTHRDLAVNRELGLLDPVVEEWLHARG